MNIIRLFTTTSLIALIVVAGGSMIITPPINAQENATSFSQSQNTTTATTNTTGVAEETTYILIFGHRIVGNIDNSTKIVSSIVGDNSTKIQEEFLEEISLAPSQQLEEQVNRVVNDGISGLPCADVSLVTEQGENLSVECFLREYNNLAYLSNSLRQVNRCIYWVLWLLLGSGCSGLMCVYI